MPAQRGSTQSVSREDNQFRSGIHCGVGLLFGGWSSIGNMTGVADTWVKIFRKSTATAITQQLRADLDSKRKTEESGGADGRFTAGLQ